MLSTRGAILDRYEKTAANHMGLVNLACVLIWFMTFSRLAFWDSDYGAP